MSDSKKNQGDDSKHPLDSPSSSSGSAKRLRDRVRFFEKVWTGNKSGVLETGDSLNVDELEKQLEEERRRNVGTSQLEQVTLRHTPQSSPRHHVTEHHTQRFFPDGSIEETIKTVEEGDSSSPEFKSVKFEKVTVRKVVQQKVVTTTTSRTPSESEERFLEDSAYQTQNGMSQSKSSSVTSLSGRFPSEESLRRTPSKEVLKDDWESGSNSSKYTSSSADWYHEYKNQSFHSGSSKLEYVRSRSQYDNHIAVIRDEQERVQKKTFVNWINSYLAKRVPPLRVEDLIEDLKDGTKLLALLEVLSGEKLPMERGRVLRRPHFLSNANTALQFLASKRIKLVNINATDLVDGRPPVVLGLIWTIILYFQIEENSRALEYLGPWESTSSLESAGTTSSATKDRWKQGARKTLLQWVANALPSDAGIEVRDFGASWRDGIAFLAIIDAIKANLINLADLRKESNRVRLATAFDVAEKDLGISKLLDPEDVDVPKPDEKSIMTYVAQFLHKYPEPKSTGPDAIAAIQDEFAELMSWLLKKTQYLEHLQQTNSLPLDYNEYEKFKNEVDEKSVIYNKLKSLIESQGIISITKESWFDISRLWNQLEIQMLYWLWLLDSRLPGDFKYVGEWLAKAEKLIYTDDIPTTMNEETATIISRKLEEHKTFFADLPNVQARFQQACDTPLAKEVPSAQLRNIDSRLRDIGPKASQRRIRLKFLEHKCCLIAFLQLTETKLKGWTVKYGRVDKVVQLLDQYRNFVSRNHIFQEFNKAFIDMQAVIEEYQRDGNINKNERVEIDRFLRDTAERWKNVSMELRCVQSMLEEVVAYWRRWDSLSVEFNRWLDKAEEAIKLPEEERMEFFQDISIWRDNYQLLGDTVSFLIATCEDKIAGELREQFSLMTSRWDKLYPVVNKYSHAGDILRNRKEFRAGVEVLSNWLRKAENILGNQQLGSLEKIRTHGENLLQLQGEVKGIEDLFKNISKTFQSLIQDLSRDDVDKMMNTLKNEKENLVRIRALIPAQIHLFNQLLVQQESLESGQKEIGKWLDDAEALLSELTLGGGKENLNTQLEKHKQFFIRTFYYQSMLESKNKVLKTIEKAVDQHSNPDILEMKDKMQKLNDRFEYVIKNSHLWEQKLQEGICCWYNFSECERVISSWLSKAEQLITEKHIDTRKAVEFHKTFFESVNERWIHDLVQTSQDLKNYLPNDQQKPITQSVERLQSKWKEILSFAPLHLMRLEFRLDETAFNHYVKDIEREIISEQQSFNKQENVESIITRNMQFFAPQGHLMETRRCLESMEKISKTYSQYQPDDKKLKESLQKATQQWEVINVRLEKLREQLDRIPEKWADYHQRFQNMSTWMDEVDQAVDNVFTNITTMEDFDREKAVFQKICQDADAKREIMKWLVQTLDSLVSHCPESQAIDEQQNLEALITRYKNLIPSLEVTMTKTETLTKCYTYKKEVREVCELLRKVKEQSQQEHHPETIENVNQMIQQQEIAVSQLDLQRPNIMTMLQRGKELAKETASPGFIQEEVKALESGWNDAYQETVDKLNKLKTTQVVWTNFNEQKTEVINLLKRAHRELQSMPLGQYTSSNIPSELQAKQELCINLRQTTEEILKKLRELCTRLGQQTAPTKQPSFEKEIEEIEEHIETTIETVEQRVTQLQNLNQKWIDYNDRVGQLQNWMVQDVPKMLVAIEENVAPEDRIIKAEILRNEVAQKHNFADELKALTRELIIDESNPESQKVKADVIALQDKITAVHKNVHQQSVAISQDLDNWNRYQNAIQEIKPWVDEAEVKVNTGMPKPKSLEEAILLQTQSKQFANECNLQLKNLQGVAGLSQQIVTKTHAPDEIDAIHSRWLVIEDNVAQQAKGLDKLVANWNEFDNNAKALESWVVDSQNALAAQCSNVEAPGVEKLEKQLAELKAFNKEISEQQAKLINLTQNSDAISHVITPEGAVAVKGRVQELKGQITNLSEGLRAKINEISDCILAKHEFKAKMGEFSNWVDNLQGNAVQVDEVPSDKVDAALLAVHSLLQEHHEKQPVFNSIYEDVKTLTLKNTPEENKTLTEEYTNLVGTYQNLEDQLQQRRQALEKWSDLLNWHGETAQQLVHIKYHIDNQKATPEDLQQLLNEADAIINKLIVWKQKAPEIDQIKGITILDKNTRLPATAENFVRDIEVKTINLKTQMVDKLKSMEALQGQWNSFEGLQKEISDNLDNTQKALVGIRTQISNPSDLQTAVAKINQLLENQLQIAPIREKLQEQAEQLMKKDLPNASAIQGTMSTLDTKCDQIMDEIKADKIKYGDIIFAWKEFQEMKNRTVAEIEKIDQVCNNLENPTDYIQANMNFEKAKKALESLQKTKTLINKLESKSEAIAKKGDFIPKLETDLKSEVKEINHNWSSVYEKILKIVQTAEGQSIIWKHIEDTKAKLLKWLNDQSSSINAAAEKPNEVEVAQAKLSKYKEELPQYQSLKQSISNKHKQLTQLIGENEIPSIAAIEKLVEEQFADIQDRAIKLEKVTSVYNDKENAIRNDIKNAGNKISGIREEIVKCEDLSGDNAKILERLLTCQKLKGDLSECDAGIKKIEQQIVGMKTIYPSFSESNLPKEHQLVKKRYDGVLSHANKIENTLISFLKKYHNEKYGALQRLIATNKEKIQWCNPEPASDKYNLEVKLNALRATKDGIDDCDKRMAELENSLKLLEPIETVETYKLMTAEKDHLNLELENLKHAYESTNEILEHNVAQHENYDKLSETVSDWLKVIENKVRNDSVALSDLNHLDKKIQEIGNLQNEVHGYNDNVKKLIELSDAIIKEMPESRVGQFAQHLNSRYQAIIKFLSNYIEKLNELKRYHELYRNSIGNVENWLNQAEQKVKAFQEYTARGSKLNEATLEELKNFASERELGRQLLNTAIEHGEALFSGITPENKDSIRAELRNLRDKSENLIDKVDGIYKRVEGILMQRHSFEDSLQQVKLWITDAEQKLGDQLELKPTLPDKKDTLHKYKTLAQDVNLHKNILQQLKDKIEQLGDSEGDSGFHDSLEKYKKLSEDVNNRVSAFEKYVNNHENFNQSVEKFQNWLSALVAEATSLIYGASVENTETKLGILENLLGQKEEGDQILKTCKDQLDQVLNETSPEGHPALINNYETQVKSWNTFLTLCSTGKEDITNVYAKHKEFGNLVDDLGTWLKQKEAQVKDQSLRSTEETKKAHFEKLTTLHDEINTKNKDFAVLGEQAKDMEPNSELHLSASQMLTRYESLQNAVKEGIAKYKTFVDEHKAFNQNYAQFVMWLSEKQDDLHNLGHVIGDIEVIQQRQKKIKDLIDERNRQSENDDLQNASNKLDQCLVQFADFTNAQEQLTKWLKNVEKAMHHQTELKATLQEKRAQLQNHKIMHQEITSHQQLVDSVCDKAQQLVDQTKDKSLNIYLQSIKQLFKEIVNKSEGLLHNLEECVDDHSQYNTQVNAFRDWLAVEFEKLQEYNDVTGEKSDISKRLEAIDALRNNKIDGQNLLDKIKEMATTVSKSTSPKGVDEINKEVAELHNLLEQHMKAIDTEMAKQSGAFEQWDQFENDLKKLNDWFNTYEVKFRDQPLCSTLSEKETQLKLYKNVKDEIGAKEREIDTFVDNCHVLLQTSEVQRIKPILSQISNRYQTLLGQSKEAINKWQNIVEDHRTYQDKLEEVSTWLTPLEEHLLALQHQELPNKAEAKFNRLQVLLSEKEQGEHKLNSLVLQGEKLYPVTAASGRETIRNEVREIKDRWDALQEGVLVQQKLLDVQSQQLSSYQDMLQQTLAWLSNMEKVIQIDSSAYNSIQDVRSKLLKQKTSLQEIISYKRIIEAVTEKGKAITHPPTDGKEDNIEENIKSINDRYQALLKNAQAGIDKLEEFLDVYQQFYDLQKTHQDFQKQLWDKLESYSDLSGNKQALQDRLNKINDLQDRLPSGTITLKDLEKHVNTKTSILPARSQEAMQREVDNMKFDLDKYVAAINDVKLALESRLKQWTGYENSLDRLLSWLTETEASLKNYGLKATVEEKQEQLEKYQGLVRAITFRHRELNEVLSLFDLLEQNLLGSLKQNEAEFDKLSDQSAELMQNSGESRISVNVQQIMSRFQAVEATTKEIIKKCEQSLKDHKLYNEKYRQSSDWVAAAQSRFDACNKKVKAGARNVLIESSKILEELLGQQTSATLLVNNTVELGEKLYPTTSSEGREAISVQLQELQQALESLYDNINSKFRDLKSKLHRWSSFEDCVEHIKNWLKQAELQLPQELELKATLDEKRAQLQIYRTLLHDALAHQQDILDLRDKIENLPERNDNIDQQLATLAEQHDKILKRAQQFVERYEAIVSNHQQYSKAVLDAHEWMDATNNTVTLWADTDLERVALHSNLKRLKNLQDSLPEEEARIGRIRELGDKVIPGTVDYGQGNIRSQIDNSQQEWAALQSVVANTIKALESRLQGWADYEALKDQILTWIRDTDTELHQVDLKATAQEKKDEFDYLKELQGKIRAKELEIDAITEKSQQLNKSVGPRASSGSQVSELGIKYQQIAHKIKDLVSKWQQYYTTHEDFDSKIASCREWLDDIKNKIDYCSDLTAPSQKDLETKLETIQDLLLCKEEGSSKIQNLVELAQTVLANTAPSGHDLINQNLAALQEEWANLASKMIETKAMIDDSLTKWAGLLEQIQGLDKIIDWMQTQYNDLSEFQGSIPEKRTQLDQIKIVEEKVRCEKIEVDNLSAKVSEMLASGQQGQAATQAKQILDKFNDLADKISKLLSERENQYKDHKVYKDAYDELQRWLIRAQEKMPQIKQRPLSDKLAVESLVAPIDALLNKQAQGEVLLDHLEHSAEVVLPSTSSAGQETIKNDNRALRESFERLFKELKEQKDQLDVVLVHWRDYKDEYERLSDWLQQIAILIKNQKIALSATLPEKAKQVEDVKDILKKLENGKEQIDKFNQSAQVLLNSLLDTYVNNQLQHLNSRYQVELNLAKDVLKKVETNLEQHQQYVDSLEKSRAWIENARDLIRSCSESSTTTSKQVLQERLNQIQELLQKREEGQNLVHATVNNGEKVLRNTRSDGREVINNELKQLQNDWDKLVKKMSTAKVHLETALLQWADYDSSYNQLQQWITDREAKLQQVSEQKVERTKGPSGLNSLPIVERKATLRETNSIVQDIVSFEPVIQSVTSKAEDLMQAAPASEISNKYETLSKQAKELYEKQKETVEQHQAFIDADADDEDKEIIEEEVALLQDDFDNYVEMLNNTKNLLEMGIVKWAEYESQYQDALDWLANTEKLVQSYNKLQNSLEDKRMVLEQFQVHLQTLFDWQKDLDKLNMKAQVLLETCADTRISNAVTQLATKYNAILSLAKEVMRRLELHYQEHQQHNALYQECQDWVERTREKLNECQDIPSTLQEVNSKLQVVKGIRTSLEQGQNKLRYVLELKEKVIINTEQTGAAKIEEDTENLKQDMDKLLNDVNDLRAKLTNRVTHLEEIFKLHKLLQDCLHDVEQQIQGEQDFLNDLSEKKAKLEKFKSIQKELNGQCDLVDKLKAKLEEDKTLKVDVYENSFVKYEDLKQQIADAIQSLEHQVQQHIQCKQSLDNAIDWIRKKRLEVQKCSDLHEERKKIVEKQTNLSKIVESLPEGDDLVNKTAEFSVDVMKSTAEEGKEAITQDIEQLKHDWEGLQVLCSDTQKALSHCLDAWKNYTDNYEELTDWLDKYVHLVAIEQQAENKTPDDLDRCLKLLNEIVSQKSKMEDLNDYCESLMELSSCGWVRDQTVQLQSAYTNLLTSAQGLVSKIEKNLSDHTEFIKAKKDLESWLYTAHGSVQDCIGVGDENSIKDKLETIRLVSIRMTEGQHLLAVLQDAFTKVIETTPTDKQEGLREDMTQLRNSWDQLTIDITSIQAQLKADLAKWDSYNQAKKQFENWMDESEAALQHVPKTKGELGEMKTLLERYKNLSLEIENKKIDLDRLLSEATELSSWAKKQEVLDDIKVVEKRYLELVKLCNARKNQLETELQNCNAYHQQLQDIEKWLLQVSFQLMAHNSLYITNREQTEQQIAQHKLLLDEIESYQANLDSVKAKGKAQVDLYAGDAPNYEESVNRQLNNVQDSYNSLLQTAVQIRNRLLESLAKFKEYEDTLESIMSNLDIYEPVITQELDKPITNLKEAHSQLETAKNVHGKLQAEKSRLAVAVQACEAASACISRPSSPRDVLPPPIPHREMEVRARLEDLIDQVQAHLENITMCVAEFEEKQKQRNALKEWIVSKKMLVNDWKLRPTKLRADVARQELNGMNDLLTTVGQKRSQLVTEFPASEEDNRELEQLLDSLEEDLTVAIAEKQSNQDLIDSFKQNLQGINNWFDNVVKRMDAIDKGSGLNCAQKQAALSELENEFDELGPTRLEDIKQLGTKVKEAVSNLDAQQIEEQLKSVERRYGDISKRLQRKMQVLEMTKKGIEDTRNEIEQAREWVKQKSIQLQKHTPLGFESRKIDDKLSSVKSLLKELDNKKILQETLLKRVNSMTNELESSEQQQLEAALKNLGNEQDELVEKVKQEIERIQGASNTRRTFEINLEKAKAWLKAKNSEIRKLSGYLPLKSIQVEQEIYQHKLHEAEIKHFNEGDLNDLLKLGNSILKECDDNDRERLQALLDEVKEESRSGYFCEIRAPNLEVLEEQLAKYEKLQQESKKVKDDIDKITEQGKAILPTITENDKIALNEVLNNLKDRHSGIASVINDRTNSLKQNIQQQKEAAIRLAEYLHYIEDVKNQLKDLNKPIGSKVEDVQAILSDYERILNDLKANKNKLSEEPGTNTPEMQNVLGQMDDLVKNVEDQITRLKQLLLLREQFIALITDIMTFITKYTGVVRDIEKSGKTVEERIKQYDDIILKIQTCEAMLASAEDKGQQIAADGTAQDRNNVTEQIQSVKQSLQNLRRAVEKQRRDHEHTAAEHRKLASELEDILDWLHANEAVVRSRPLLRRDIKSVEKELENHYELSSNVNKYLDRIREVQEVTKNDDSMPGSLLEQLSEANSLWLHCRENWKSAKNTC
ncbi:hypothetical protein FQR65_LT06178 [Abscondita terminalis]|nr:hypothetical protein FQR65_LT06178 [Abscondita terminalis]